MYIKYVLACASLLVIFATVQAQKPVSGTYTFKIAFEEWNDKSLGATCTVIIKGDSIMVMHNGKSNVTGHKGDIFDQGILMRHTSGKWIIAHSPNDRYAKQIGGCTGGPSVIDFRKKVFRTC